MPGSAGMEVTSRTPRASAMSSPVRAPGAGPRTTRPICVIPANAGLLSRRWAAVAERTSAGHTRSITSVRASTSGARVTSVDACSSNQRARSTNTTSASRLAASSNDAATPGSGSGVPGWVQASSRTPSSMGSSRRRTSTGILPMALPRSCQPTPRRRSAPSVVCRPQPPGSRSRA